MKTKREIRQQTRGSGQIASLFSGVPTPTIWLKKATKTWRHKWNSSANKSQSHSSQFSVFNSLSCTTLPCRTPGEKELPCPPSPSNCKKATTIFSSKTNSSKWSTVNSQSPTPKSGKLTSILKKSKLLVIKENNFPSRELLSLLTYCSNSTQCKMATTNFLFSLRYAPAQLNKAESFLKH